MTHKTKTVTEQEEKIIKLWAKRGRFSRKDFMIIIRDLIEKSDYAIYTNEYDFWGKYEILSNKDWLEILDVFDLKKDVVEQMSQEKVFNPPEVKKDERSKV